MMDRDTSHCHLHLFLLSILLSRRWLNIFYQLHQRWISKIFLVVIFFVFLFFLFSSSFFLLKIYFVYLLLHSLMMMVVADSMNLRSVLLKHYFFYVFLVEVAHIHHLMMKIILLLMFCYCFCDWIYFFFVDIDVVFLGNLVNVIMVHMYCPRHRIPSISQNIL